MGTKNLNENGPNPFFFGIQTHGQSQSYDNGFVFGMVSTTSLSLSMRGRYNNEVGEREWPPIF